MGGLALALITELASRSISSNVKLKSNRNIILFVCMQQMVRGLVIYVKAN